MFIASFPAGPWQTNCYLLATEPGAECVIVDPGMDAVAGVADLVREHRLKPVAVLLTHGHLDHMFSVLPVCTSYESTCWVHTADRGLLVDPLRSMSEQTRQMMAGLTAGAGPFAEPDDVRELADGSVVQIAGLSFAALHAPGHTPGSTMFSLPLGDDATDQVDALVLSGDVLFAGSVGRTDLPGGSPADMQVSLRTKVLPLPDSAAVLPGHGPQTTMAQERATNPYLQFEETTA